MMTSIDASIDITEVCRGISRGPVLGELESTVIVQYVYSLQSSDWSWQHLHILAILAIDSACMLALFTSEIMQIKGY